MRASSASGASEKRIPHASETPTLNASTGRLIFAAAMRLNESGARKSYHNAKHYKRRKRWLA